MDLFKWPIDFLLSMLQAPKNPLWTLFEHMGHGTAQHPISAFAAMVTLVMAGVVLGDSIMTRRRHLLLAIIAIACAGSIAMMLYWWPDHGHRTVDATLIAVITTMIFTVPAMIAIRLAINYYEREPLTLRMQTWRKPRVASGKAVQRAKRYRPTGHIGGIALYFVFDVVFALHVEMIWQVFHTTFMRDAVNLSLWLLEICATVYALWICEVVYRRKRLTAEPARAHVVA